MQHSNQYTKTVKNNLISEWEIQTGQVWPTFDKMSRKTGQIEKVDAQIHHIIPQQVGGPHQWWNIHPLKGGTAHQAGVHGIGAPLTQIMKNINK